MPAASGVFKTLAYKVETTYGTAAGTPSSGAQYLRRVTSDLNLVKDTYTSNEIRTDQQMGDMRHGVRRVQGTISGELSPLTYSDLIAAALRKDPAAVSAMSSLTITIAGAGPYTLTRSAGDFLAAGVKKGMVVRLTAGAFTAGNLNKNLLVTGVTATVLTVRVLNGTTLTTEGPIASATVTVPGKSIWTPTTGHTNKSFSIEHWFSDLTTPQSELYLGCQPASLDIALPASGLSTIGIGVVGQGVTATTSQYYSNQTASTTTGLLAAVNGMVLVGGTPIAALTGLTLNVQSNRSGDPVVGSNVVPTLFAGRVLVSGQATAYFDSVTLRDNFLNESEFEVICALTSDNTAGSHFLTFTMPRVKANGHTLSDGESGLVATIPFQALLPTTGGTGIANEMTTLLVHDSAIP